MNNLEYEHRLMVLMEHRLMVLPILEYRRARGDMNETFKIIHDFYDAETVCSLFKFSESAWTRGHFQPTQEDSSYTSNQYAILFIYFQSYKQLEQLATQHCISMNTKLRLKKLPDKYLDKKIYSTR